MSKINIKEPWKTRLHILRNTLLGLGGLFLLSGIFWSLLQILSGWLLPADSWWRSPWVRGLAELWLSITLTLLFWMIFGRLIGDGRPQVLPQLNEAFARIARGDFKVQVSDPTPIKEFQSLFDNMNNMTESLARMEELRRQFVADVSHEFQSPLTSILGFTQSLKSTSLSEETRQHYLDIVEIEARRLSRLSENLLKLSALEDRDGPPDPLSFRLDAQIRRALATMEPQWSAKRLAIEADLTEITINGNEELWDQVWINLIQNAIKFTPPGGCIAVWTNGASPLTVELSDSGIGLTPEEADRVFERFYKADSSRTQGQGGSGSGLGLALVQRIVNLHGGTVSARSAGLGQGTTFRVELPA